jgi:hypothetical protein
LWVRETWSSKGIKKIKDKKNIIYKADFNYTPYPAIEFNNGSKITQYWQPSIFMPKWASRITLDITRIRVDRLKKISIKDIILEGSPFLGNRKFTYDEFIKLWNSIYAKRGYEWDKDPWVWVIEFKKNELFISL